MIRYILAIDQSTSGTKAILFDSKGRLTHRAALEHRQFYPKPGWVEHDPQEIYDNTLKAIDRVLCDSGVSWEKIAVIAITNQRETVVVWDKITGKPVYNAVVWQCGRAAELCDAIKEQGNDELIREKTGLVLSPFFSAAKLKWILDNVNGAREKAEAGRLLMGTMDSWLIWKMTGGEVHATDYSNASRTQLFNIMELQWDKELLGLFTIPESMLPQVRFSDDIFGYTQINHVFTKQIPISGVLGDSHAALFGQNCFEPGMAKATYGTGSSIMMNIGERPKTSESGLVTSVAWGMKDKLCYVFEGNINSAGATIKWLVDDLKLIDDPKNAEIIAQSVDDSRGIYIVPAFSGLGAPYWDSEARAMICGITRGAGKAHIVRAAEESIAYQVKDILDRMTKEANVCLQELRVDGGPTRDQFLMQFQADILDVKISRSAVSELSALGSAYMAGYALGFWDGIGQITGLRSKSDEFVSNMEDSRRKKLYDGWIDAVKRALSSNRNYSFGGTALCRIPNLQKLMDFICGNGFEHHVAMNRSLSSAVLKEALGKYLGWEVYVHN